MIIDQAAVQLALPEAEFVVRYWLAAFDDVQTTEATGYRFFCYGADRRLPFATLAAEDNAYDRVLDLGRPGAFRRNFGLRKNTYRARREQGVIDTDHDFAALDQLRPHPPYAPLGWGVCSPRAS